MDHYTLITVPGDYAGEHPVAAATIIPTGCFVAMLAAGNAVKGDAGVAGYVIGRSEAGVDNTGGAAGDAKVLVRRGIFACSNDATFALTKAHIGKIVFLTAPDTVGHTGTCRAGVLIGFDDAGNPMVDTTQSQIVGAQGAHDVDGATLLAFQSGELITNLGAAGAATFVLPTAVPGIEFNFAVKVAQQLRIDPAGNETIELPSTAAQGAAGKYLWADAIGEFIRIRCIVAGTWSVVSSGGTWTHEA
jgi:hypothetical protein